MKLKSIFLTLIILTMFIIKGFCVNPADIKYITFYTNLNGKELTFMQKYINDFNSDPKHPIIQVKFKNFTDSQEFLNALKHDNVDIALINNYQLNLLHKKLLAIDNYMGKTSFKYITLKHDTFKNIFNSIKINNVPYLIPYSAQTITLMYNKKIDEERKLKIRKYWSWLTFKKYKDRYKDLYIIPLIARKENTLYLGQLFYMFLKLSDKKFKNINSIKDIKSIIDLDTFKTAYNLFSNFLLPEDTRIKDKENPKQIFINFIFMKDVENLNKDTYEIYAIPKYKNYSCILQTKGFAIFNTKNSIKNKKYVLMLISHIKEYKKEKERALTLYTLPVNKQVYLHPDFLKKIKHDTTRKYFLYQIKNSVYLPQIENARQFLYILGESILEGYDKKLKPEKIYNTYLEKLYKLYPQLNDKEKVNEETNNKPKSK